MPVEMFRLKRKWLVYTREEAEEENIEFTYWRDINPDKPPKHILTDDSLVVPLIRVEVLKDKHVDRKRFKYITPIGDTWASAKRDFTEESARKNWVDIAARSKRVKGAVQAYTAMLLNGKVDWDLLGRIYRDDQKIPAASAHRLFKQEKIKRMVMEELRRALENKGITDEYIAEKLKNAIEIAEGKGDVANLLKGIDTMVELKHEKGKVKTTETLQLDSSLTKLLEEGEETESRVITATRETEKAEVE